MGHLFCIIPPLAPHVFPVIIIPLLNHYCVGHDRLHTSISVVHEYRMYWIENRMSPTSWSQLLPRVVCLVGSATVSLGHSAHHVTSFVTPPTRELAHQKIYIPGYPEYHIPSRSQTHVNVTPRDSDRSTLVTSLLQLAFRHHAVSCRIAAKFSRSAP